MAQHHVSFMMMTVIIIIINYAYAYQIVYFPQVFQLKT
jgi:hypothetical protein